MRFDLKRDRNAVVIASTDTHSAAEAAELKAAEIERRGGFRTPIEVAASQFIARRNDTATVIAGYPWFTDWGRDTMVSLPGLTLATGRFDIAREILLAYTALGDQGMLPNTLAKNPEPASYNSVDAALWLFEAVRQYVKYSGDLAFVRTKLYESLESIIEWHVRGTRSGIRMDRDGLLCAGDENTQLTWMDARVNGIPVTPRSGKPIEIQGLWYNALRFMQSLAREFGDAHGRVFYEGLACKTADGIRELFWNESGGYFHDRIRPDGTCDASLRPNQLIALSLGYCAMPGNQPRRALDAVERSLLTPYGLRSLAPDDPAYRGRCTGPQEIRDAAYHQGTVWPWMLGPFIAASLRFRPEVGRERVEEWLRPLLEYAQSRGCGQLPEIFDGDAPHEPRGCFAQAWSVAEILRFSL
jgi:predicted glycogen debranching enzyme